MPKKISFGGTEGEHLICMVCGKHGADRHVLHEQADGHYYAGLSFHNSCFNITQEIYERRQELGVDLATEESGVEGSNEPRVVVE